MFIVMRMIGLTTTTLLLAAMGVALLPLAANILWVASLGPEG